MLTFHWNPDTETRAEAVERFRKTGALPPEGVKLLGRWTRADFSGGRPLGDRLAVNGRQPSFVAINPIEADKSPEAATGLWTVMCLAVRFDVH